MTHIDLFSGIGGFAYAADQVWDGVEHIFCEIDPFCQKVLRKHWKESVIYGDIREFIADADKGGCVHGKSKEQSTEGHEQAQRQPITSIEPPFLLTGGFPCQPFSQAGKRKGTNDDRYLWKEMLRVIQLTRPTWVIAENVRGILTIEQGMVFEQVCLDLEAEGYEVQPIIIPAVAVNAPHRRDRVWFVANRRCSHGQGTAHTGEITREIQCEETSVKSERPNSDENNTPDTGCERPQEQEQQTARCEQFDTRVWERNWLEVATELCGMDDGLPAELDFAGYTKAKHRVERLKSLGNAIVPKVAVEIMMAIFNR